MRLKKGYEMAKPVLAKLRNPMLITGVVAAGVAGTTVFAEQLEGKEDNVSAIQTVKDTVSQLNTERRRRKEKREADERKKQFEAEAQRIFSLVDVDRKGYISVDHLLAIVSKNNIITRQQIEECVHAADLDHDEVVNLTEFIKLLTEVQDVRHNFSSLMDKDGKVRVGKLANWSKDLPDDVYLKCIKEDGLDFKSFTDAFFKKKQGSLLGPESLHNWLTILDNKLVFNDSGYIGTPGKKTKGPDVLSELVLGGTSSALANLVTNPLDVVKCEMQVRKPGEKRRTFPATLAARVQAKGIPSLWNGIQAAILRSYSYSAVRLGFYSPAKELWNATEKPTLTRKCMAGITSGAAAAMVANPVEIVKVRMQLDKGRYNGTMDAFVKLVREEGFKGVTAGLVPHVLRGSFITAAQIGSYDHIKSKVKSTGLVQEGIPLQFFASMASALITTTVSSPFDVVKTVVMANGGSVIAATREIIQKDGVIGLMKGWTPNYARLGPQTVISFMIFERLRSLLGLKAI